MLSANGGSMRVTHPGRAVVSIRMTSAPRWARVWVQNGPAHAQVKSSTRTPLKGESAITFSPLTSQLRNIRILRILHAPILRISDHHARLFELGQAIARHSALAAEDFLIMLAQ